MNMIKLKFLCLLLFAMHQSVFAATGAGAGMAGEPALPSGFIKVDTYGGGGGTYFISGIYEATRQEGHFFSKNGVWTEIFSEKDARGSIACDLKPEKDARGDVAWRGKYYSFQHLPGNLLTIRLFNSTTESWQETNVVNVPTNISSLLTTNDFHVDSKDSAKIIWLREPNPEEALDTWTFFDPDYEKKFQERVGIIRKHWEEKCYPFKSSPVDFRSPVNVVEDSSVDFCLPFQNPGEVHFKEDGTLETMLHGVPDLHAFVTKPYKLELCHVTAVDGYSLPYYTLQADRAARSPRPVLWYIDGGPVNTWTATFEDPLMDWFLKHNFLIVIPRERIREGFGYKHYEAGVGNLHKQALEEAIAAVNDVIYRGLGNAAMVVGHGQSYGGYALSSMATRWTEFEEGAKFKPLGFIAEASLLAPDFNTEDILKYTPRYMEFKLGAQHKEHLASLFPLGQSRLEIPLVVVHGVADNRCPIETTRAFHDKFGAHELLKVYVEHNGGHISIVDAAPDELGLRIIQNIISRWLPGIMAPQNISTGELAAAKIDVKKGEGLLHVVPSPQSHSLHLFGF